MLCRKFILSDLNENLIHKSFINILIDTYINELMVKTYSIQKSK